MRALVVYEKIGSAREIAAAVAEGLRARGAVTDLLEVADAPAELPDDLGLLVVGASTQVFGRPRQHARTAAGSTPVPEPVAAGIGLRDWVDRVRPGHGQPVATFATKVDRPRLPGSAARMLARRLRDRGASVIGSATFYVSGGDGALVLGESVRARAWAGCLAVDAAIHRVC